MKTNTALSKKKLIFETKSSRWKPITMINKSAAYINDNAFLNVFNKHKTIDLLL